MAASYRGANQQVAASPRLLATSGRAEGEQAQRVMWVGACEQTLYAISSDIDGDIQDNKLAHYR